MVKSNFLSYKFAEKLQEVGISKKQAEDLEVHFYDFDEFTIKFKDNINKIITSNENENEKAKELLEDLWGELEHHVITNHLIPAKEILNKITDEL
jgi:hypothetical protein